MVARSSFGEWLAAPFIPKVFHAALVNTILLDDETRAKIFVPMDDDVNVVLA